MNALLRLYETLRRLRPSQPAHRLVRRAHARSAPSTTAPVRWVGVLALPDEARRPRCAPFDRPEPDGRAWTFAGARARVGDDGRLAWDESEPTELQRYHAAYGEVVRALVEDGQPAIAERWLGAIDIEPRPYVRSRRILSLVEARARGLVTAEALLVRDAAALFKTVERDVRGNHLCANAVALERAGHAFAGPSAKRWASLGRTLLTACVRDQVLEDGVHYERSPAYQGLVLEHLLIALETAASAGVAPAPGVEDGARRLAVALAEMQLPDGELMRRGDGAPGLSLPTDALLAWARRRLSPLPPPRAGTRMFSAAGLVVVEDGATRSAISLIACAPCPRELPAHGHADALACEIVLNGVRVVASAGTAAYGEGRERDADRLPGAFAGAMLDGRPPADPYGAFRVGARGWVRRMSRWDEDGVTSIEAYSDGYSRAIDPTIHRRVVAVARDVAVVIDEWTGRREGVVELAWPLAPGLRATIEGRSARIEGARGAFRWWASDGEARIETGRYAALLGVSVPRDVLWNRVRVSRPSRCVHVVASGVQPIEAVVTPAPGGVIRVTLRRGTSERAFHVNVGHRP